MPRSVPVWLAHLSVMTFIALFASSAAAQVEGEVSVEVSIGAAAPASQAAGLEVHVQNLSSIDAAARLEAARSLGELGDPQAIPALTRTAQSDPRPEVRGWALRSLYQIGTPEAVALVRAVGQTDADERVRALVAQLIATVEVAQEPEAAVPSPAPTVEAAPAQQPVAAAQPAPANTSVVVNSTQAQEGQVVIVPQQAGYGTGQADYLTLRRQRRAGRGLRIAGWITFGTMYFASFMAGIALSDNEDNSYPLFIPLVGPAIVGTRLIREANDDFYSEGQKGAGVAAWLGSLVQIAGFSMLVAGYVRRARARRNGYADTQPRPRSVALIPTGNGLSLSGLF